MTKIFIFVITFLLMLAACGPTDADIQTAIALTEEGRPTESSTPLPAIIDTSLPTDTPEPTASDTPDPTNTPIPTLTPTLEPQAALLGDLVEEGGYSFAAPAVADPAPLGTFYEEVEGSKLVASGKTFSSNVLNGTLLDSDGFSLCQSCFNLCMNVIRKEVAL